VCRLCTGYKLVDVPELGYTTQDKPYPRGELRLKTKLMIPGYYKHPKVVRPPCSHAALATLLHVKGMMCSGVAKIPEAHDSLVSLHYLHLLCM